MTHSAVGRGRRVRGILDGDSGNIFVPRLIELYARGHGVDRLTKFCPLDELERAAEDSERGDVWKPLLRMD